MVDDRALERAARQVAALHAATGGRPGRFRAIDDCARRAGIKRKGDIARAVAIAEAAGFLVKHIDQQMVMLTAKGREVAKHPGSASPR